MTGTLKTEFLKLGVPSVMAAQVGKGVLVGVLVMVGVFVLVGVLVTVGVLDGVFVGRGVFVEVRVSVGSGVFGIAVGILKGNGVLMARVARNCSTIPWRKDAKWIMDGSIPKIGRTMKVKL